MAHFAELNENNIVKQVIVVHNNELLDENGNESEAKGIAFCQSLFGGTWVQTSYNATMRGKFAGIGFIWDGVNFLAPIEETTEQPTCATKIAWYNANRLILPRTQGTL